MDKTAQTRQPLESRLGTVGFLKDAFSYVTESGVPFGKQRCISAFKCAQETEIPFNRQPLSGEEVQVALRIHR